MFEERDLPQPQDVTEVNRQKELTWLQRIGRKRFAQPVVRGAGALLTFAATACSPAYAQGVKTGFQEHAHYPPKTSLDKRQALDLRPTQFTGQSWVDRCPNPHPVGNSNISLRSTLLRAKIVFFPNQANSEILSTESNLRGLFGARMQPVHDFYNYYLGIEVMREVLSGHIMARNNSSSYANREQLIDEIKPQIPESFYRYNGNTFIDLVLIPGATMNFQAGGAINGDHGVIVSETELILIDNEFNRRGNTHEAGHSFGWPHNNGTNSIMDGTGNLYDMSEPIVTWADARQSCFGDQSTPTPVPTATPGGRPVPTPMPGFSRRYIPLVSRYISLN